MTLGIGTHQVVIFLMEFSPLPLPPPPAVKQNRTRESHVHGKDLSRNGHVGEGEIVLQLTYKDPTKLEHPSQPPKKYNLFLLGIIENRSGNTIQILLSDPSHFTSTILALFGNLHALQLD